MSEDNKDLGDMAEDAKDAAKETAKKVGDKAEEVFEDAKEATKEFAEDAKETTKEFTEEAKETADEFVEGVKDLGGDNKKILAGILAIIFGGLGIHKFILGYNKEGGILLGATIIGWITACFIIGYLFLLATWIIGVVEGIIYLTKSDEDFVNTYQIGKKPWF